MMANMSLSFDLSHKQLLQTVSRLFTDRDEIILIITYLVYFIEDFEVSKNPIKTEETMFYVRSTINDYSF